MPAPWADIQDNDVIEATLEGTHDGQQIRTTFHYQVSTPPTAETPIDQALDTFIGELTGVGDLVPAFLGRVSEDYQLDTIKLQVVQPFRHPFKRYVMDLPGDIAVPSLPSSVAVSIERRGGDVTRNNIGRIQMPAVPNTWVADSIVDPAQVAVYNVLAAEMLQSIPAGVGAGSELIPVLINANTPVGETEAVWLQSAETKNTVRTMRRRVVGRGI